MTDDLFSRELENLEAGSLLRKIKVFESSDGRTVTIDGKSCLLFCSNDYLGLSRDKRVIEAVIAGLEEFGLGSGASRLVSGTTSPHLLLEKKIAEYMEAPAALLFNSGYAANTGIIPAITGKGDVILADRLNHASLVDGCLLSRAEFKRYPHADMNTLEKLLIRYGDRRNRWIITDGLFSMDGDLAPLPEICELAKKYDARIYLDDAHAFGIFGENGRGTPEYFGVEGKVDLYMATLGKAAGAMGAFAVAGHSLTAYITNAARSFIFSTAMPPSLACGCTRALEILSCFKTEREGFWATVASFHDRLKSTEFATRSNSYIIPLVMGRADAAISAERLFLDHGIYLQAIRPPTVPEGTSRLRLTLSLAQREEDRQKVLDIIRNELIRP